MPRCRGDVRGVTAMDWHWIGQWRLMKSEYLIWICTGISWPFLNGLMRVELVVIQLRLVIMMMKDSSVKVGLQMFAKCLFEEDRWLGHGSAAVKIFLLLIPM